MAVYFAVNSFNAGELSPKMLGRLDVAQYERGCQTLENFMVTPYGAVERRAGTRFIAATKNNTQNVRLIPFVFSEEHSYICEFGNYYIRFFKNAAPVTYGGSILQVVTPYTKEELPLLQFIQSADVMTIVHPNHPVMELKRIAVNSFTISEKDFEYPPMLDPNTNDAHTLRPSAVSGDITLTANLDTFTAGNVGGYYELVHVRENNEISHDFYSSTVVGGHGETSAIEVFGYWTFTTHGTWTGRVTLQRSYDNGTTWKDFRTYSSAKDSNTSTSGTEEDENVLYRVVMDDYETSSSGTLKRCRVLFVNPDFTTTGVVRVTAFTDAQHVAGTVIKKLGGTTATSEWNEGAWSARRGYPRTIAYFEERMMFGGNDFRPQTVWGSKTNDWDNFLLGDKDDDAIDFTLASDTVNEICWMCQHDALVIGTSDSEWTLSAADASSALTPSNFRVRRQSVYGSNAIHGCMAGETILFVQRGGRKIREFVYSLEKNGYVSPDLTILADHITESGIIEIALQQLPDTMLWCLREDGKIAVLTYERNQEVVGWQKFITDGTVVSVCVIPNGEHDDVYMAVKRGTANKVFVEKLEVRNSTSIYSDAAVEISGGTARTNFSGFSHLSGKTVQVVADGARVRDCTVSAQGGITLDEPASHIAAGLAYTSLCKPMPIEVQTQSGWTVLRKKAIGEVRIRYYESLGGEVKTGSGEWQNIISRDVLDDNMDTPIKLKTEVFTIVLQGGYEDATSLSIRSSEPSPFNLTSLVTTIDLVEQ